MAAGLDGDVKIGLSMNTKSAEQSLSSFRKKLRDGFSGTDTKALDQSIKQTEKTIRQLENQIEKTKQKLQELSSQDVKPKSIIAMQKEFEKVGKDTDTLAIKLEKLQNRKSTIEQSGTTGMTRSQNIKIEDKFYSAKDAANLKTINAELAQTTALYEQASDKLEILENNLSKLETNPKLTDEYKKYNKELENTTAELKKQKQTYAELKGQQQNIASMSNIGKKLSEQFNPVISTLNRIKGLIKRVFMFSVITSGLRQLRTSITALINGNTQLSKSLAQIKGSLYTAFAPIWQICIPWIQKLLNALSIAAAYIAKFMSMITSTDLADNQKIGQDMSNTIWKAQNKKSGSGKSGSGKTEEEKNIENQIKAIEKQNKELEKQKKLKEKAQKEQEQANKKSVASFDQLITLDTLKYDAELDALDDEIDKNREIIEQLQEQLDLLQDKREEMSGGVSAPPLLNFAGLQNVELPNWLSNLALTIKDVLFNWKNLTKESILQKLIVALGALTGAVIGWSISGLSGAVIGIAIGAGLSLLLSSFIFNNDGNISSEEILKLIVSVLVVMSGTVIGWVIGGPGGAALGASISLGLSLLIDKLVFDGDGKISKDEILKLVSISAAIAGVILMISKLLGAFKKKDKGLTEQTKKTETEAEAVKDFSTVLEGVPALAYALIPALDGVTSSQKSLIPELETATENCGKLAPALDGVTSSAENLYPQVETAESKLDNFNSTANAVMPTAETVITSAFDNIKSNITTFCNDSGSNVYAWVKNTAENIKLLSSNIADNMYEGLNAVGKNITEFINNSASNFSKWATNVASNVGKLAVNIAENFANGLKTAWNNFKDFMSATGEKISGFFSEHKTQIITASILAGVTVGAIALAPYTGGLSLAAVPLANGAVLPPNQPFLAMVGDQKHGTNVEAPLDTIVDAVMIALSKTNIQDNRDININFTGNLSQLARVLNPIIEREQKRGSTKLVTGGAY